MATGILGQSSPGATTNTTVYTVPSAKVATCSISVCNKNATPVTVRLALAASGTPADGEYIEYDAPVAGNSVLERSGIVLQAAKLIVAYCSATGVNVNVWGYEA